MIDGDVLVAALGPDCTASRTFAQLTVDAPPAQWVEAVSTARDLLGCGFFDWLSAADDLAQGYSVVCHLWSVQHRHGLLVRTRVPLDRPSLPTLTGVFAGANWHERETYEMFGVVFVGHPNLVPLLLPDGFEGHPLRKEFVLASRVAKEWPGAREPGESAATGPVRRRMRPPGVPDPAAWGPDAVSPATEPEEAATEESRSPEEQGTQPEEPGEQP
ncbi:MAG: NADH-quinone oxidoreductase subunit C [Pseudonocardiales bacterium]